MIAFPPSGSHNLRFDISDFADCFFKKCSLGKFRNISTRLYGITSQKTLIFTASMFFLHNIRIHADKGKVVLVLN
jgi:hypothetical protein